MGEEEQGNLDSFVDIIANTAGIMIVLVVMSLMNSNKAGSEVNIELVKLSNLKSEKTALLKEMPDKAERTRIESKHQEARETLEHGLKQLNLEGADSARIRRTLQEKGKANVVSREKLDKLTTDEQGARNDQEKASREVGEAVTAQEREFLRDKDVEDMRDELDNMEQQTVVLKERRGGLAGDKTVLEGELRTLNNEIKVLEAQGGATLEAGGPLAKMARERQAVWAECFRPEEGRDADEVVRPCVRLVSVEGFGEKEKDKDDKDILRVKARGESTFQILEKDSNFQKFLAGKTDEDRGKLYLMFIVRPNAYPAFRLARKIARDDYGWKVHWRPIAAGNEIAFPGRAPPATTARGRGERTIAWTAASGRSEEKD